MEFDKSASQFDGLLS